MTIFESYCHNILFQTNAPQGRYGKDDLRTHVLRMPHAKLTMIARDLMLEELPIILVDISLYDWIDTHILPAAENNRTWEPIPFMARADTENPLPKSTEWAEIDRIYMPQGLEPCLIAFGDGFFFENNMYAISEFRFLPLKSYEYRKD